MSSYLSSTISGINWQQLNQTLGQYSSDLSKFGAQGVTGLSYGGSTDLLYSADAKSASGFDVNGTGEWTGGGYTKWTSQGANVLQSDIGGVDKTIQSLDAQASLTDAQKTEEKSLQGLRQQLDALRMVAASNVSQTNGFTNAKNVNQNAVWNALNSTDPATLKALQAVGQPDYSTLQSDGAAQAFMAKLKDQMTKDEQPAAAVDPNTVPDATTGLTPPQQAQVDATNAKIGDLTTSTLGDLAAQQQATTNELTTQLQQNAASTQRLATEAAMGGDVSGSTASAGTAAMNNDTSGQQSIYKQLQDQQTAQNTAMQGYFDSLTQDEQGLALLKGNAQQQAATYATQSLMNTLQQEMQQGSLNASLDLGKVQNEITAYNNALQSGESGAAHIKNILQLVLGAAGAATGAVLTATGVGAAVGVPLMVGGIGSAALGGAGLASGQ